LHARGKNPTPPIPEPTPEFVPKRNTNYAH
jgi:hypothetical protein